MTKRVRTVEGGCQKCEARRVKCDLKKPCSKCVASNHTCQYGKKLKFKTPRVPAASEFIDTTVEDLNCAITVKAYPRVFFSSDQQIMYFENILSPRLTVYGKSMSLDSNQILRHPVLTTFIKAVAAAHKMNHKSDSESMAVAKLSRSSAISELKQKIVQANKMNLNVLFAGNVFLCLLDGVIDPNEENTIAYTHLKGGKAILQQMGSYTMQMEKLKDPISVMMLSYFGTIDLTNSLLNGSSPHFGKEFWFTFGGKEAWWGILQENDPFLEVLSMICDLSRKAASAQLLDLSQILTFQYYFQSRIKSSEENLWFGFCHAFCLTGLIYLYRKICGFERTHALVQCAVAECVEQFTILQSDNLHHCLLFPLLIVGCNSVVFEQQEVIRQSIIKSYNHLMFGNVRIMWMFLERKWSEGKSFDIWEKDYEEISQSVFLF